MKERIMEQLFGSRPFAIFGGLIIVGIGMIFGPIIVEHGELHVLIGFGMLSLTVVALYVAVYLDIRRDEEDR